MSALSKSLDRLLAGLDDEPAFTVDATFVGEFKAGGRLAVNVDGVTFVGVRLKGGDDVVLPLGSEVSFSTRKTLAFDAVVITGPAGEFIFVVKYGKAKAVAEQLQQELAQLV